MSYSSIILWGFAATLVLTSLLTIGRALHLTRMDIPFLVGTIFTSDREKAKWLGFLAHLVIGWLFAFIYASAFEKSGLNTWWFGMTIGLVHACFVLTIGMDLISNLHPRMATEDQGPDPTRMLEPPGFLILNYGRGTPLVTTVAHLIYGGILGTFYQ
jgi:ABC-type uncharacterized transport system permease subunit